MISIKKKKFLAKGKRSNVYTAFLGNKKVGIKVARKDISVKEHIANEAKFLKILNKKKIGPKLLHSKKDSIIYKFIEGERILDWMEKANKKNIKRILKDIFEKCYILDSLQIEKKEMHHPIKHILIEKNNAKMIDFERCRKTEKPKNTTQFCQFLISKKVSDILTKKGFKKIKKSTLISLVKDYKKDFNKKNIKKIINLLK
ncbi:hypothetical protein CL621_04300 [archaeon]|nr:hypothetical protein [archaeon]|tara:strand:+ start:915 stop:1517 length:603 start_codon:yes stop_codon:yes gene_type:complete